MRFLPLLLLIVQASWLRVDAPAAPPRLGPAQRIAVPVRVAALYACRPGPGPRIDAPAVVLMDLAAGQVLYQRAAASARPVARASRS